MTDDIVTRLRELREVLMGNLIMAREVQEAMDEIEYLRADLDNVRDMNEQLTEELQKFYSEDDLMPTGSDDIVTRLRQTGIVEPPLVTPEQAADEIERLRALHRELTERLFLLENGIKNLYEKAVRGV